MLCKACGTSIRNYKTQRFSINCRSVWTICLVMLAQNEGDAKGVENGFEAMSRHPFGDHSFSQSTWCHHIDNPPKKYTSFPYGKPLKDKFHFR